RDDPQRVHRGSRWSWDRGALRAAPRGVGARHRRGSELRREPSHRRHRSPRGPDGQSGVRGDAMSDKLLLEKDGPIGWIVFNQPEKRNAVSQEMWELMPEHVNDLAKDDAIRVVILRGGGDQSFVSGADISQFKDKRKNMADEEEYRRISARGQDPPPPPQKPPIAVIHGVCVGGRGRGALTRRLPRAA